MQNGSVIKTKRRSGQSVWEFRWRDRTSGKAVYRRIVVGTMEQYKTEADAREIVEGIVLEINSDDLRLRPTVLTVSQLIEHYRRRELSVDNTWKSYATKMGYENYLKRWIAPKWGMYPVARIKPIEVELWLRQLPLACGSCAKIRNIMSAVYSHAIRWEWVTRNPITHVRQSAKRRNTPVVLTIEQIKAFLSHLEEPCRTAVLLDASSGLRVGELLGLKWEDVNFEALEVNVTRAVVKQKITRCKTEASRKPIPLDAELAEVLLNWKLQAPYAQPGDWVFASPHKKGKQPYWPGSLFRAHLKPALEAAEIPGNVGWHMLRHTFGTLMKANGEDIKTIQELLRHSNYKVTADTYTHAVTLTKRAAQTKLVKMILLPR